MKRISCRKNIFFLVMSFFFLLSIISLDGLSGQGAYAMGKKAGRITQAQARSVPAASENSSEANSDPASVPEPSTLILITAGALGVAFAAYRKKFKKDR